MKKKIFFDSNIFIYAADKKSLFHDESVEIIKDSVKTGFFTSDLCLLEFYQVITDGRKTPRPLSPEKALLYIQKLWSTPEIDVLEADILGAFEEKEHQNNLDRYNVTRFDIYDYLIAACLKKNQIRKIVTFNSKDFKKYPWLTVVDPRENYASRISVPCAMPSAPCASPSVSSAMPSAPRAMRLIPYGRQSMDEKDVAAVCSVLRSDWLTQGPKVAEFESALCDETDADFAVCLNSGTSALHIACLAAGVGHGDEVVTSPITFVASANCAVYCGARPVFADIYSDTYNISPEEIEKKITSHTKAIIPVHFAGQSCDMDAIRQIVSAAENKYGHKIYVIEDACHALGSEYRNKKVGCCEYSDMSVFSFHPVKHITTGEGGMVVTNDEQLGDKIRMLRSHGITNDPEELKNIDLAFSTHNSQFTIQKLKNPWYYEQVDLGFNYRITDIQCALGLSQLEKLGMFRKRRREIVNIYNKAFSSVKNIQPPFESTECDSNFHLYVLLFDFEKIDIERARFMLELRQKGIQTQVHYIPVHLQPFYRKHFGTNLGDCPNAEQYYKNCLSIPLYPAMTDDDVEKVITAITNILNF